MAKKSSSSSAAAKKTSAVKATAPIVSETPVRNSSVPPKAAVATRKSPSHSDVQLCAYYIWQTQGGSEFENWISAERKLTSI